MSTLVEWSEDAGRVKVLVAINDRVYEYEGGPAAFVEAFSDWGFDLDVNEALRTAEDDYLLKTYGGSW